MWRYQKLIQTCLMTSLLVGCTTTSDLSDRQNNVKIEIKPISFKQYEHLDANCFKSMISASQIKIFMSSMVVDKRTANLELIVVAPNHTPTVSARLLGEHISREAMDCIRIVQNKTKILCSPILVEADPPLPDINKVGEHSMANFPPFLYIKSPTINPGDEWSAFVIGVAFELNRQIDDGEIELQINMRTVNTFLYNDKQNGINWKRVNFNTSNHNFNNNADCALLKKTEFK